MRQVELVRVERGARKVACTKLLQAHCGLSLAAAKAATDALLQGRYPVVTSSSDAAARELIVRLSEIGVVARFLEGTDFDPQERLASVLALVRFTVTPEVLRSCESLSGHGEWEIALSICIAAVEATSARKSDSVWQALEQLAIEL